MKAKGDFGKYILSVRGRYYESEAGMRHEEFAEVYAERFVKLCLNEDVPKIRPSFTDQVDLGWLRELTGALLAYSEDARYWVYDVGRYAGRLLAVKLEERGILENFLQGRIKNSLGIFSMKRISDDDYRVQVVENVFSYGLQNFGIRFDWFLAGVLGSLVSGVAGEPMGARELDCYASGASSCTFQVRPVGTGARTEDKGQPANWAQAVSAIAKEYLFRSQVAEGRTRLRPTLGDGVDLSLLRLLYGVVFTYSPEVRTLLYAMGKKAGAMMGEAMPEQMKAMISSGDAAIRDQEGGFTVERKGENRFYFRIPECPAHGKPNIGEVAGYLEAGFGAGMFEALLGKPVGAKEIMCPSKGDPECVMELRVLE